MSRAPFRDNYDLESPSITKSVMALHDAAAGVAVWTPASGKRVVITGYNLQCYVGVTLQNAAAGDYAIIYDSVTTAPIALVGVCLVPTPMRGSLLNSGAQMTATPGTFAPAVATGAQSSNLLGPPVKTFYRSSAKDNVIKFALVVAATGVAVDVGTGELRLVGTIWGHEEDY